MLNKVPFVTRVKRFSPHPAFVCCKGEHNTHTILVHLYREKQVGDGQATQVLLQKR